MSPNLAAEELMSEAGFNKKEREAIIAMTKRTGACIIIPIDGMGSWAFEWIKGEFRVTGAAHRYKGKDREWRKVDP